MANLEHGVPLAADSIFRIGSTSKQFTAASLVLLAQEGKLQLDDDVRKHMPEMPLFDRPITLHQLLHHTSGVRDYLTLMSLAGRRDDDYYTDADVLRMLSQQQELNFSPGTEHLYSNSGYWLLSQVVERASGRSLREFAEVRIFAPLAMHDTHFHDDHTEIVPNRAVGFRAQMLRFPEQRTTIICLCNRADANPSRRALEVADIVLENHLGNSEEASEADAVGPKPEPAEEISEQQRLAIAGTYASEELGVEYHLLATSDGIRLSIDDSTEDQPVEALAGDRLRVGTWTLHLQHGPSAKITGFLLDAGRVKNLRFSRLEP